MIVKSLISGQLTLLHEKMLALQVSEQVIKFSFLVSQISVLPQQKLVLVSRNPLK